MGRLTPKFSWLLNSRDKSPHISLIEQIANMLQPRVYLEIGVYRCATFNRVAKHSGQAIAVDIDDEALKFAKGSNVSKVSGSVEAVMPLLEAHKGNLDLVFIDGDHRIEALRKDFESITPYMSLNGMILIHDTWPKTAEFAADGYCSNSYLFPDELSRQTQRTWSAVTIPVHPGLTLVSRTGILPPWCSSKV